MFNGCNRYLGKLRKYVKNKAQPEGSIANAYIRTETAMFCSYFFDDDVSTKANRTARNADTFEVQGDHEATLDVFRVSGRPYGESWQFWMSDREYKAAHAYVLQNCSQVEPFLAKFYV